MAPSWHLRTIVSKPFEENTYILGLAGRPDVLVVDPGYEPDLILESLRNEGQTPAAILNTHGHLDHIAGNAALKTAFADAPIVIGALDAPMLTDANLNFSNLFGMPIVSPPADRLVTEGDHLNLAGLELEVLDIPGHSPGHVVFVLRGNPTIVLGGDVLFRDGIGRTDYPGGSFELLCAGIRAKLWPLPDDTIVYPGHGPVTTIGHEKRSNSFLR